MNQKLKIFIILLSVLVLSFGLAESAGLWYEKIIGYNITNSWIGGCAECFEGFIITFSGLAAVLLFGLLNHNRINISLTAALILPMLCLITGQVEIGLIALGFAVVGLGLGQALYWLRKKIKTAKMVENKEGK